MLLEPTGPMRDLGRVCGWVVALYGVCGCVGVLGVCVCVCVCVCVFVSIPPTAEAANEYPTHKKNPGCFWRSRE